MRQNLCLAGLCVLVLAATGCAENKTRIGEGAGIGGVLGAAAGTIIGYQSGHPLEGALIGGAAGAGGGALIGSQIEKQPTKSSSGAVANGSAANEVSLTNVVDWTEQGQSGDEIIAKINASHTTFSLTKDDVDYLRKKGVSQRVIEAMQAAK